MTSNVRDSDTSLWLHNKLGTSNDSWISGSICSQLNKEVLRNIKDCFPDLQTQVKLKLLLSFFHIPRRLVEEWKTELEEIIEVAGIDSELWVSMVAETIKTFPSSGSLNTEILEYEETRPIFADMVNDLRKLVSKHSDLGMLPLECQYLNKNALVSVVGQQPNPIKHFTLKRKPKSATLRTELLQKSADAQSSLKKASAPTIPLRSRGMPRKMTDTTPLKGIPSRVPTTGFRSPTSTQNQNRPNMSRTPAGRKDGGIKLIEFTEQPLGYAAAKKRKRQQELEEQQKKALEAKQVAAAASVNTSYPPLPTTSTPDYAAGLTASSVYTQPSTPAAVTIKEEFVPKISTVAAISNSSQTPMLNSPTISSPLPQTTSVNSAVVDIKPEITIKTECVKIEAEDIKEELVSNYTSSHTENINTTSVISTVPRNSIVVTAIRNNKQSSPGLITTQTQTVLSQPSPKQGLVTNTQHTQTNAVRSVTIPQLPKSSGGPVILSQTIIQPAKQTKQNATMLTQNAVSSSSILSSSVPIDQMATTCQPTKFILTSSAPTTLPSLTSFAQARPAQTIIQTSAGNQIQSQPTKILLKTAPTIPVMISSASRTSSIQGNPPPLISTQPTILNIQNVNLPNRPVTIQPASQAAQVQHMQAQLQQQQQQQQQHQQQQVQQHQNHTVVSNNISSQQPKFAQVVMSPGMNVKGKTIILAQKGVILRSMGGDVYQQIPLGNVSGLSNLGGATIVTTGPPGLVKASAGQNVNQQTTQQIPALIPTNSLTQNVGVPSLTPVVISSQNAQQPQQTVQTIMGNPSQQTIIRPVLPQGLTLIQRPGQQPQLVQMQSTQQPAQQQIHRTIITQQPQTQIRPQQIIIQHKPQTIITTQQLQQQVQVQQAQPQQQIQQPPQQQQQAQQQQTQPLRKGLSLSTGNIMKAHEMFRKANRVTRPDKALILGFMAGMRENPRPNPENVIVIKLGETEEKVKQEDDSYALMLVESLIRLDYNTGEWKTFQNYRRLDQTAQTQQQQQNQDTKIAPQSQNSVVI